MWLLNLPRKLIQLNLFQAARMLLRVDDVVQAVRKERDSEQGPPPEEMMEG